MSDKRNPPVAQAEGSGEPLEFERLVSGFIAHQDRKSSGGEAPEVPEAKDSFIVRERSGNLIQGGFEHSEKSTSESGCPSAQRGFSGTSAQLTCSG
jgi:hypothetical protein